MVELRIGDEHLELSWDEWEARVRSGRVPPTALVRFEPATGKEFVPAERLELYHSLREDGVLAWQGQFTEIPPLLTALLVGVQLRLWWLATWTETGSSLVLNRFTLHQQAVFEDGEVWRLLTMGFAHKAAFHVGLNLLWLAYCGWNLERALGRVNLLILYVASVFVGSLFSMYGDPATPSLGASGGVFGLVAASIVFGFARAHLLEGRGRQLFGWALVPYVILMFGSGLASEGTDNWAHLGGLLTGGVLALVLDPPTLQRGPRWNAVWTAILVLAMAGTSLGIAALGPRVSRLASPHAAVAGRAPIPPPKDGPVWSVPAGWKRSRNAAGDSAFVSGRGFRSWSVVERTHEAPRAAEDLRDAWVGVVVKAFPNAVVQEARPDRLAGEAALHTIVVLPTASGGERRLDHRVAARGLFSLEATWEVEVARRDRLEPLEQRLRDALSWPEPSSLTTTRASFERDPDDPRVRDAWATELARNGRFEEAFAIRLALVDAYPGNLPYWSNLLDLLAWYPGPLAGQTRDLLQRALDTHPSAPMSVAVAEVLEVLGDEDAAVGLLDHAWHDLPGERTVRRARAARDLPIALNPDGEPWDLVLDPLTNAPRPPELVAATRAAPLTLDGVRPLGVARRDAKRALIDAAVEALETGDVEAAIDRTAWIRDGAPANTPTLRDELRRDLADAAGANAPTWMPEALRSAARRHPVSAP